MKGTQKEQKRICIEQSIERVPCFQLWAPFQDLHREEGPSLSLGPAAAAEGRK